MFEIPFVNLQLQFFSLNQETKEVEKKNMEKEKEKLRKRDANILQNI